MSAMENDRSVLNESGDISDSQKISSSEGEQ